MAPICPDKSDEEDLPTVADVSIDCACEGSNLEFSDGLMASSTQKENHH